MNIYSMSPQEKDYTEKRKKYMDSEKFTEISWLGQIWICFFEQRVL